MTSHYLNHCCPSSLRHICSTRRRWVNTLRPRQNGRLFADDTFKRIYLNKNVRISNKISLKFVPKGLINNIPALVLIMAWRRPGDKPLSEPMMVRSLTHICVTQPQWVKKEPEIETLQNQFSKFKSRVLFFQKKLSYNIYNHITSSWYYAGPMIWKQENFMSGPIYRKLFWYLI